MNKQFNGRNDITVTAVMLLLVCLNLPYVLTRGQLYNCITGVSPAYIIGSEFINGCIICVLAIITLTDIRVRKIPNACVLSLIGLWLIKLVFQSETADKFLIKYLIISNVMTAVVLAAAFLFARWTVNKIIRRRSLGGGDIKLAFAAGLILEPSKSIFMLLIACVLALVTFIIVQIKDRGRYFPFGPAISIATGIMILYR